MLKFILLVVLTLCSCLPAFAVLPDDGGGTKIQLFAPNGMQSQLLTINSVTIDMTRNHMWLLYSPTACKVRYHPTAIKSSSYIAVTIPVTTFINRGVHKSTPFITFSGCTNGELQRE